MTPESVIARAYNTSQNFMTPDVLEIGWIKPGTMAYELSSGYGISRQPIYGVSIAELDDNGFTAHKCPDLSRAVFSYRQAHDYIIQLKEEQECSPTPSSS